MINPRNYDISIRTCLDDNKLLFEARVKELPDLVEYAETYEEAYDLAVDAIETGAEAYAEQDRAFPEAHSVKTNV